MLKRLTFLVLISGLLLGVVNVYGTQPQILSSAYVDSLNVLQIVFDQPVYIDSTRVIRDGITINGYFLDQHQDFAITGGFLPGDPEAKELADTVRITVTIDDQKEIEKLGYAYPDSLRLIVPAGNFINEQYEGNVAVSIADNMMIQFFPYIKPATPENVVYDAGTNKLGIKFSKMVKAKDKVDYTKIAITDGVNKLVLTSAQEFIDIIAPTDSIVIDFTPKHQQVIEEFDTANLSLVLDEYAFFDLYNNTNKKVAPEDNVGITFIPDPEPLAIESASYSAKDNKLSITFSEKVVSTYKRYYYEAGSKKFEKLDAVDYAGITVLDSISSTAATLSGSKSVSIRGNSLEILVLPADQILIETLTNKTALKLLVKSFAVLDANLNGIREYTLDDDITVEYTPEADKDAPVVVEGFYHASTNQLELHFGNISSRTKGIDTTNVTLNWIQLHNAAGDSVALSGGDVHGVKAGQPKFVRNIYIDVTPDDEMKIENLTDGDSLILTLKPLTFFFESYRKTGNGNHILPLDSQMVIQYIPDTLGAEVTKVKYDYQDNELTISFNKKIKVNTFNSQLVNIGGVQLTGGEIKDSSYVLVDTVYSELAQAWQEKYNYNLVLDVLPVDQASIESLDITVLANLPVKFDANNFVNLDGYYNKELNILNGDTTSTGDVIFTGYGRSFWDKSYEAFPTADQLVPASLRAVGDHCYIFVADAQWTKTWIDKSGNEQPIISQANVDSFLVAFEQSTPADPNKGIYDICREYFGEEIDTDGDSRITILFMNLRDEYGRGRANRASDVPRAGDFLVRNELPADSLNAHSAETDMIYIDTTPIVRAGTALQAIAQYFTHMLIHGNDTNEEQWLIEGMAGLAPVLCGYQFTSHRFPAENPKAAANKSLNFWTGWDGGTPDIDIMEFYNTGLFFLYLYEQFGGETIKAIASNTKNGLESIRMALPANTTLEQVFDDYAVAGFLDRLNHPIYGDKYGFKAVDLGFPTLSSITWSNKDYQGNQPQWSFSYYKTKKTQAVDKVRFNGNNDTNMSLIFTTIADTFLYKKASLDTLMEAVVDISELKVGDILTTVTSKSSDGPTISDYVISKDLEAPAYVNVRIMQNPSVDRNLSIFVISDEHLYNDVPAENVEGPLVTVKKDNVLKEVPVIPYFSNNDNTVTSYLAVYSLTAGGNYTINVTGQDMAGNDFAVQTTDLTVTKILAQQGGDITDKNSEALLTILPGSIARSCYFTLSNFETEEEYDTDILSKTYRFGPAGIDFNMPAKLTLRYNNTLEKQPVIYRIDDSKLILIGGEVDEKSNTITAYVDKLGDFIVLAGEADSGIDVEVPDVFSLSPNYPNPFNPATQIQYGLPEASHITLAVYNVLGQRVDVIFSGNQQAGFHKIQWDASRFTSGIYFYRLSAKSIESGETFSKTRKMMLIR